MRLISWNVNGIRAVAKKGFCEWLQSESPDILCLQETKAEPEQLTSALREPEGYQSHWSSSTIKKGYSGVATFCKSAPITVKEGLGETTFDQEGRVLLTEHKDFCLWNLYVPNGSRGNARVPFKMAFNDLLMKRLTQQLRQGKKIVICGDINTAHQEIDLARPKENQGNTGFLPEEREWITDFLSRGFVDIFRRLHPEPDQYTWWDYKTRARERNVGWRIDYFFISENLLPKVQAAYIMKDVMGSDHCPIALELKK